MDSVAKEWVVTALRSSIPEHIPLPFEEVLAARFLARKKKTAAASLLMIDGKKGVIEVSKWMDGLPDAWTYRWVELGGGALNWNGTEWERIDEEVMFERKHEQLEFAFG
ncbi:hypothetical protein [Brevibacillus panacihumi]|uniref:hypothetical protein n=1 Tax=Brevibacillus panacihumi TaxID=497735 RepID=UPI003D1ABEB9